MVLDVHVGNAEFQLTAFLSKMEVNNQDSN